MLLSGRRCARPFLFPEDFRHTGPGACEATDKRDPLERYEDRENSENIKERPGRRYDPFSDSSPPPC